MKKSGEKKDAVKKEIEKKKVDAEEYRKYPREATLIVNPASNFIPEDQKIKIDMTFPFGEYAVFVRFWGAAKQIENDRVGYQIAVQVSPHSTPHKGRYTHVDDFVMLDGNDIQLALDHMRERIKNELAPEVHRMIAEELRNRIAAARAAGEISSKLDRPWFLHDTSDAPIVGGKGLLSRIKFVKMKFNNFFKGKE